MQVRDISDEESLTYRLLTESEFLDLDVEKAVGAGWSYASLLATSKSKSEAEAYYETDEYRVEEIKKY
jgi:hypothetical protein